MKYVFSNQEEYEVCVYAAKKYKISRNPEIVEEFIKTHEDTILVLDDTRCPDDGQRRWTNKDTRCPDDGQGIWILDKIVFNNSMWNPTNFLEWNKYDSDFDYEDIKSNKEN